VVGADRITGGSSMSSVRHETASGSDIPAAFGDDAGSNTDLPVAIPDSPLFLSDEREKCTRSDGANGEETLSRGSAGPRPDGQPEPSGAPSAGFGVHPGLNVKAICNIFPAGLVVVDESGTILFANELACSLLESGQGIADHDGQIHVESTSANRGVRDLIRAAVSDLAEPARGSNGGSNVIGVHDHDGQIRYALKVLRLHGPAEDFSVVITITDLVDGPIDRFAVAIVFGLSNREAEFAELFSRGLRLEDIAPRMGVTINTARVHLRHVLAKTGCANQVELARRFALMR
jgi:DNA-binding CsgD family transcriptional regulator